MRISDWSSDVCSSDLHPTDGRAGSSGRRQERHAEVSLRRSRYPGGAHRYGGARRRSLRRRADRARQSDDGRPGLPDAHLPGAAVAERADAGKRKSVGWGKRGFVSLDLGGRLLIKKKNRNKNTKTLTIK